TPEDSLREVGSQPSGIHSQQGNPILGNSVNTGEPADTFNLSEERMSFYRELCKDYPDVKWANIFEIIINQDKEFIKRLKEDDAEFIKIIHDYMVRNEKWDSDLNIIIGELRVLRDRTTKINPMYAIDFTKVTNRLHTLMRSIKSKNITGLRYLKKGLKGRIDKLSGDELVK
ncbi:hypothetical protein LCGC14_3126760, partial [marine sediment metagenome]